MNNGKPGLRAEIGGWTAASSRRNMRFLWSVEIDKLTGAGWSFTLTVRNCPPTPKEWAHWCTVYWKRLFEAGAIRLHWVIEWQRRGCPHLHGSIYFPESMTAEQVRNLVIDGWAYRNPYDAGSRAQRILPIYEAVGWMQYVAKHAARGVQHYQRSPENIPKEWKGTTGRMWGSRGDWPRGEPLKVHLEDQRGDGGWHAFRRLVRSYAVAKARAKGDTSGKVYARAMLKANTRVLAECRGVSTWAPSAVIELLMENLDQRGYSVKVPPSADTSSANSVGGDVSTAGAVGTDLPG